jgi:hypothetical protein
MIPVGFGLRKIGAKVWPIYFPNSILNSYQVENMITRVNRGFTNRILGVVEVLHDNSFGLPSSSPHYASVSPLIQCYGH